MEAGRQGGISSQRGWWAAGFVAAFLLVTAAAHIAELIPRPWREGPQMKVGRCLQSSVGGSPQHAHGATIEFVAGDTPCSVGYAMQRRRGRAERLELQADQLALAEASTLQVALATWDGWRRVDRTQQRITAAQRPARIALSVDVAPRARLVEVTLRLPAHGRVSIQGLRLVKGANAPTGMALYDEAFDLIQRRALNADRLPGDARERWRPAAGASSGEARRAIRKVLQQLGDGHSFLLRPELAAAVPDRARAGYTAATWTLLPGQVGHLQVPGFTGGDRALRERYAGSILSALAAGTRAGAKAWIVDLRRNGGGNMWPMLEGLEPLLRGQPVGAFEDRDQYRRPWRIDVLPEARHLPDLGAVPVAVLTSQRTASSGEAVAVAFRGRPRTRSFGRPTSGHSTGNSTLALHDGTELMLTTTRFVDRSGQAYGAAVEPDVTISRLRDDAHGRETARRWLLTQHAR